VRFDELQHCANGRPIRWARGVFDPLLAEHARRLEQLRSPDFRLAVAIHDPERPLLPLRGRAELVAALAVVDFVVLDANSVAAEDLEDLPVREQFSDHVRRRNAGNGAG
jgi:bifunctional ADP-heptose synthase (sugar kinase/adenylyltransferase)